MAGGGAERQLVYLAGELVRRCWDVHVALLKEGRNFEGLVATGAAIHKIAAWGNHDIAILWRLVQLIRHIRPHLVQTWLTQMDVFGGISAKLTGTPFILSERSCASAYPPNLKNNLRAFTGRYASAIVANSPEGIRYWRSVTGNDVLAHVVHNALPMAYMENIEQSASDLPLPVDSRVLLFAGRFSPEKNIDIIIKAFKIALQQRDAVLLLCGEGELRRQIEKTIEEENLKGKVLLPGFVTNLPGLMKRATLLISVSSFEGFPNVVLEAMACGCPLILSDIPAHRAFLDDEKAVYVDQGSAQDLARAIQTMMDNPEKAQRLAWKAVSGISSYSISAITDQYEKIYQSILSR